MQFTTIALAALATSAYAQSECTTTSYNGQFSLRPVNITAPAAKRSIEERQNVCSGANSLVVELKNGVLTDSQGRIGSIVANYQFQFDGPPPQAGALVVDGYSICGNNSLATNGQALWYQCSDNTRTSIYGPNLTPVGDACYRVYYEVIPCNGGAGAGGSGVATQEDGQPMPTMSSCVPVTTMSDGQPVVSSCPASCVPITTLSDGQPVVSSCPTTTACVPISTMLDGQPTVVSCPTATAVPSTSACVPVTTMSDGQPVVSSCPTAPATAVLGQSADGQVSAPASPTASTPATAVLGQSADGQVVATGALTTSPTPSAFLSVNGGGRIGAATVVAAFAFVAFVL